MVSQDQYLCLHYIHVPLASVEASLANAENDLTGIRQPLRKAITEF